MVLHTYIHLLNINNYSEKSSNRLSCAKFGFNLHVGSDIV